MKTPRGFKYGLEPLRLKGEWDLLEIQQLVAGYLRTVEQSRANQDGLKAEYEGQRVAGRHAETSEGIVAGEVARMRRSYMSLLTRKLEQAERATHQVEQRHQEAVRQAMHLQRFNDGLAKHLQDQLREHQATLLQNAAKEADDAWAQRRFHVKRMIRETS